MQIKANTPEQYINQLPVERQEVMNQLRKVILDHLPEGFSENISYVVPHSVYPAGYHCDRRLPLPFLSIASHKNFVAVYHMGLYADKKLMNWFLSEYPKHCRNKLDIGKSCIRFRNINQVPYELIGELAGKMKAAEWIRIYETTLKR
ncbi:DUF1801 domain-containing protein [Marinilabiliaceae bacterium JC017]|nr:DUF1801 domain-containing protein [Marinilabiliaceae bacterium JC017]